MKYMVIAKVAGVEYLTKVESDSMTGAECKIMSRGICGKYEYGVDAALAFDAKTMKTDTFIGAALCATPIDFLDLMDIIERHNENIKEKEAAKELIQKHEKTLADMKAKMAEIEEEIAEAKKKIG